MNGEDYAATALCSVASLAALWMWIFHLYPDYRLDRFRHDMFVLRDALFDEAHSGALPFDHPAYGLLRSTMNGFIRFAHRMNLWQAIVLWVLVRRSDLIHSPSPTFRQRWSDVNRELPPDTAERLNSILFQMNAAVLVHLVRSSPVLVAMVFPSLLVWLLIRYSWEQVMRLSALDQMDSAAFAAGKRTMLADALTA